MSAEGNKIITLYSGIGTIDYALGLAGFDIVATLENDHLKAANYQANRPSVQFFETELSTLCTCVFTHRNADGVFGDILDDRIDLAFKKFYDIMKVIKDSKVSYFVISTHPDIFQDQNQIDAISKELDESGYICYILPLSASDFGDTVDYTRDFYIGFKKELDLDEFKMETAVTKHKTLETALRGWDDSGKTIEDLEGYHHCSWEDTDIPLATAKDNRLVHPTGHRFLTIKETTRLLSIPDSYNIIYNEPQEAYKFLAETMPVNLAFCLALAIRKYLEENL